MFKSQLSGKQYGPGIKPERIIVETREVTYVNRVNGLEKVTHGTEIVKELIVGPDEIMPRWRNW